MIEVLVELMKKLTVFMVIGKTILHLDIGKGYEKYTKLIISFMVLVQLISGITSMWQNDAFGKLTLETGAYYSGWKEEMSSFEQRLIEFQKEMEDSREAYIQKEAGRNSEEAYTQKEAGNSGKAYIQKEAKQGEGESSEIIMIEEIQIP